MTALSVTNHVAVTLSALEQIAINDHVTLEAAGVYGPAAQMAARADRWRTLGEMAILLDEDPHFARAYAAAAVARSAALAAARHPGDQTLAAEAAAAEQAQVEIATDPRIAMLADARRMLDFLAANPELPVDTYALEVSTHTSGTDADRMDAVDQAAELLGAEAGNHGPAGYHYQVSKKFGSVTYTVVAVPSDRAVEKLTPPAGVERAKVLDEDQPAPLPAAPARGHGQDDDVLGDPFHDPDDRDCGCASCLPGDPDEHDPDEPGGESRFTRAQLDGEACTECGVEFVVNEATVPSGVVIDGAQLFAHFDCVDDDELAAALLLDDDAGVTHAASPSEEAWGGPLRGDVEADPVYSNQPTCPTCRSLRSAGPADTDPGESQ